MSQSSRDQAGHTQIGRAVVLVAVTVAIALLVLHHFGGSNAPGVAASPSPTTTVAAGTNSTTTTTTQPVALVPPAQIKLQVLNGLLSGTLAGNLSTALKASPGYDTLPANNTTTMTSTSAVYVVTKGYYPEAQALAKTLGLPDSSIISSVPVNAPFPTGVTSQANLVVVIGTSLQAKAST